MIRLSRLTRWLLLAACLAFPVAGRAGEITVFAAASLKTALDQAVAGFRAATGTSVVLSYGGTPQLALQIQQGAPADLFLSASASWMDRLQAEQLIDASTRTDLWGNTLVLVSRAAGAAPLTIDRTTDLAGLLEGGKLSLARIDSVPAGQYARQALDNLGLWAAVESQVVQSENVRVALELVASGEAALGIVYGSDAVAEPRVHVLGTFPPDSHEPIVFPGAVTANAGNPADAAAFLAWLAGPARADFAAQGFTVLTR